MRVRVILRAVLPAALALGAVSLGSCHLRGAQAAQSPLLRYFERPVGLILYIASDGNVHVIDQKGGGRKALTSDAGTRGDRQVVYGSPAWSPNGKLAAFTRTTVDDAGEVKDAALFTAGRDGRNLTQVLSGTRLRPFYLYWSPDSTRVSLLSAVAGQDTLELGLAPAGETANPPGTSTRGYRRLDSGSPFFWDWRPDGGAIVAHVNTGQDGERLSILDLSGQVRRWDMKVDRGFFQAPGFSPDGKSIAYASTADMVSAVHLGAADGSGERTVARDVGGALLELSRDGKRIAYLSVLRFQPVREGSLSVLDLGAPAKKQTLKEAPVLEFSWAPDGRTIAFVVADDGNAIDPMFLRDESIPYLRLMGFDVSSGKTWVIARFPPSRGFFNVMPYFDQYQRSSTTWSPDSRYIGFTALTAEGTSGLFVAQADGNVKPRFLAPGDEAFWSLK